MSLRRDLRTFIAGLDLDESVSDDTSLIRSGLLDSVGLFQLVLWLEQQIGTTVNPAEHDLVGEWDTIDDILRFIERYGSC
jgi:acyl carrier protein